MKLFIAGISGLLGINIALQLRNRYEVVGTYLSHIVDIDGVTSFAQDLSTYNDSCDILYRTRPDVIINAAALTDVDKCETHPDLAYHLNVELPRHLGTIATELKARLVHISSDQLFDGSKAWINENESPCPVNQYGYTKVMGEEAVLQSCPRALVIRTNFFGWGTNSRKSFSDWILNSLHQKTELRLFSDVYFNPILINQLIDICMDLVERDHEGVFHVVGRDRISKYEFGTRLAEAFGYDSTSIIETSIDQFHFIAHRPKEMTLNYSKTEEALGRFMPNLSDGFAELDKLKEYYMNINVG